MFSFKDIIGQEPAKQRLIQEVQEGRIPHAQLFCGPAGVGKLPLALAYARYICCPNRTETDACGTCPSCVKWNKLVHPDVHFVYPIVKSAKGKKYEYYIDCREKPDVFSRRYCYHYPEKLDIEAMRDATKYLIGPKNFTSFTDDKECKDPIRKITNIKIVSSGEKVRITYYGTGFLYHMVRILTGTLLEIGAGKRDASMLPVVIAAEDRSLAGFLAPARGLFLRKVYY